MPISVFNNGDIHDDVSTDGCPFITSVEGSRADSDETFEKFMWMIGATRDGMKELFNLTDEYIDSSSYHDYYHLCDTAVALDYEGQTVQPYFTPSQWENVHEFQKVYLSYRETQYSVKLECSRLLRKPMSIMR